VAEEPFKRVLERVQWPDAAHLLKRVRYYRRAEKAAENNLRIYVDYGMRAIVAVDAAEWENYQQALCEEGLS
jgi:hypothetical protein